MPSTATNTPISGSGKPAPPPVTTWSMMSAVSG
jgi:hypothetical protein